VKWQIRSRGRGVPLNLRSNLTVGDSQNSARRVTLMFCQARGSHREETLLPTRFLAKIVRNRALVAHSAPHLIGVPLH